MPSNEQGRLPKKGIVTARLVLDMVRIASHAAFGNGLSAPRAVDVLLLCAVFIGAAEGRAMNASKLSHFADVPRPTAVRRLAALQRSGFVQRRSCGTYVLGHAVTPELAEAITQTNAKAIQRAAAELSKMDT